MRSKRTQHDKVGTKIYRMWYNMKQRCSNKNRRDFKYYGGRGITVCEEWEVFTEFDKWGMANGYSDELSIDRINTDEGYNPDNCRFITMQEQANNKREYSNNTSGFRGVDNCRGFWRARVSVKNKLHFVGHFTNPLQAAFRRDKYIIDNKLNNSLTFNW